MDFEETDCQDESLEAKREVPQRIKLLQTCLDRSGVHEFLVQYVARHDSKTRKRIKADPKYRTEFSTVGSIRILSLDQQVIFSITGSYQSYIYLVLSQKAFCPLDPTKDSRFELTITQRKWPHTGVPCKMIVSLNGSDSAALRGLRTKLLKK